MEKIIDIIFFCQLEIVDDLLIEIVCDGVCCMLVVVLWVEVDVFVVQYVEEILLDGCQCVV